MIDLYEVVEAASSLLDNTVLVLHRSITAHSKFKIYKLFNYDLYKIIEGKKELISHVDWSKNVTADRIEEAWKECDKLYLKYFINWVSGNEYKEIKKDGI